MVELIARARQRVDAAMAATFAEERQRFDALAPAPEELEALAADLRAAADELRGLPAVVPMDAIAMFGRTGDGSTTVRSPRGRRRRDGSNLAMTVAEPLPRPQRDRRSRAGPPPRSGPRHRACLERLDDAIAAAATLGVPTGDAEAVRSEVGERLGFPADTYVLALVGGTGVGKSSLLNALAGTPVSDASARRPTTAHPMAWVPRPSRSDLAGLLDWLGVADEEFRPRQAPGRRRDPRPARPRLGRARAPRAGRGDPAARGRRGLGHGPGEVPRRHPPRRLPRAGGCRGSIGRSSSSTRPIGCRPTMPSGSNATWSATWRGWRRRRSRARVRVLLDGPSPAPAARRRNSRGRVGIEQVREWLAGAVEAKRVVRARLVTTIAAAVSGLARTAGIDSTMGPSHSSTAPHGARRSTASPLSCSVSSICLPGAPGGRRDSCPCPGPGRRAARAITSRIYRWSGTQARVADPAAFLARWRERGSLAPALDLLRTAVSVSLKDAPPATRATLATSVEPAALGANLGRSIDRAIAARASTVPSSWVWTSSGSYRRSRPWLSCSPRSGSPCGSSSSSRSTRSGCLFLGQLPIPIVALVAALLTGYLIARLLGFHAGWVGRRWARRLAGEMRESVAREVETSAFAGLDRLETARRALWTSARGAGEDCATRRT